MATRNRNHRNSRRRGVRASRARLYHALTEAGFRSQAALAEKIADLEGLDQAPKDLVSRVFREQPVELHTLERVARALGVEAWTLYLSSDEPESAQGSDPDTDSDGDAADSVPVPRTVPRSRWAAALLIGLLLGVAGLWWFDVGERPWGGNNAEGVDTAAQERRLRPSWVSEPTLVLKPFDGDADGALTDALRAQLSAHFRLASPSVELLAYELDTDQVAARLGSDAVVGGEIHRVGRLAGVRVFLHGTRVTQQVWAQSVESARLDEQLEDIAARSAQAVARALGMPLGDSDELAHFPLAPVQDYYMEGRLHLDGPASELNIRRAQGRFEAALRIDANYADAHAGLCEALLEEYWMEDAQRALNDASLACGRAIQLAPRAPATRIAYAHLLRVTGRADEAIAELEAVLEDDPDDATALVGLVASRLALYRGNGDAAHLEQALAAASHATAVDPGFWKPPFWMASLAYFAGDLPGAIAAAEEARSRDENEYVLANLGTFYFCADELELARGAYERARVIAPHSYVGDEFLGMLYHLLGDYQTAAELRERAIERLSSVGEPEIHEMWGNLADAYLRSGQREAAVRAYLRAIEITERDVLQGLDSPADRASRAYYYSQLAKVAPERLPADAAARIEEDLYAALEHALEPGAAVRVAKAWLRYERPELALRAFEQAVERCGGFASTPELAALRPMLAAE
ncbi:MAG: tetratricopeptide repeat protein [Gammaproteobacteria bacterium]|nr:tetratricopeptide repeat protein [Gammaproteobacteria bacterium]